MIGRSRAQDGAERLFQTGMNVYRRASVLTCVALCISVLSGGALAQAPAASCSTFNVASEPSSRFKPGDAITIRGTGFGPRSRVLINLQQGTRTVELARATANDLGAFRATNAQIPTTVVNGRGSIRALDAKGSAICAISISGAAKEEGGLGLLYVVWGTMLVLFGAFLAIVRYRRWKAERLRDAVADLARSTPTDGRTPAGRRATRLDTRPRSKRRERRPAVPDRDGKPAAGVGGAEPERSEAAPKRRADRKVGKRAPRETADAAIRDESFAEEWAFAEQVPAKWVRGARRRPAGTSDLGAADDDDDDTGEDLEPVVDDADDVPVDDDHETWRPERPERPERPVLEPDLNEPPLLPDDTDDPGPILRPRGEPSEAIARLRREVRSWKRS